MPAPSVAVTPFELHPRDGGPPVRGDRFVRAGHRPRSALVVVPGFKGFRRFGPWPALAKAAALRGHAVVTVDLSHNGIEPDGEAFTGLELFARQTHTRNVAEIRRVVEALARGQLLEGGARRIGVLGHSRGGGEAILAAAGNGRVRALVTWAAIASVHRWSEDDVARWRRGERVTVVNGRTGQEMPIAPEYWHDVEANLERLDIRRAAQAVAAPWLIVHGDADASVPLDDGQALFDMAGERAELLVVEGGDHVFGARHPYAGATPELRVAAEATLDFFDAQLGSNGRSKTR